MNRAEGIWLRGGIALACLAVAIAGCRTAPPPATRPAPPRPPGDVLAIPDAVPRSEPRSAHGNPPFYEVFGHRYFVLPNAVGFKERGVASWYGPGFHAERTASGERYDMYQMTAAHRTLPLPTYVRVTHLANGRSVVVRVNDRGPFKSDRIIDLSYTAAARLGMLGSGTALVEVEAITPGAPAAAAPPPRATNEPLFVQAGAFGEAANAERLVAKLKADGVAQAFVRHDAVGGRSLYRVRIGPIPSVNDYDRVLAELRSLGVMDARLAWD
jgi:peptidoglycan lytic transglycosylase